MPRTLSSWRSCWEKWNVGPRYTRSGWPTTAKRHVVTPAAHTARHHATSGDVEVRRCWSVATIATPRSAAAQTAEVTEWVTTSATVRVTARVIWTPRASAG